MATDEFANSDQLSHLNLSYNALSYLNNSLVSLKSLRVLDLAHNNLSVFSLRDVSTGLLSFEIDVSHNRLRKFVAFMEVRQDNSIPSRGIDIQMNQRTRFLSFQNETKITLERLHLEFNELETLDGFMAGVNGLQYLNISHNKFSTIPATFLEGLSMLDQLDVSYNRLLTLDDISKVGKTSCIEVTAEGYNFEGFEHVAIGLSLIHISEPTRPY